MGKPGSPVPLSGIQHCVCQLPSIPHILGNRLHKLSVAVRQEHTSVRYQPSSFTENQGWDYRLKICFTLHATSFREWYSNKCCFQLFHTQTHTSVGCCLATKSMNLNNTKCNDMAADNIQQISYIRQTKKKHSPFWFMLLLHTYIYSYIHTYILISLCVGRSKVPVVTVSAIQHCAQNRGHVFPFDI